MLRSTAPTFWWSPLRCRSPGSSAHASLFVAVLLALLCVLALGRFVLFCAEIPPGELQPSAGASQSEARGLRALAPGTPGMPSEGHVTTGRTLLGWKRGQSVTAGEFLARLGNARRPNSAEICRLGRGGGTSTIVSPFLERVPSPGAPALEGWLGTLKDAGMLVPVPKTPEVAG